LQQVRLDGALRALGGREIGAGLAILAQPDRPEWLWARVAGDGIDLSYLATEGADRGTTRAASPSPRRPCWVWRRST
jgi:hypothetical protein